MRCYAICCKIYLNIHRKANEHLFILKLFELILNKTSAMIISAHTDNLHGPDIAAEHGISYLAEHDGKRLLFDTAIITVFTFLMIVRTVFITVLQFADQLNPKG